MKSYWDDDPDKTQQWQSGTSGPKDLTEDRARKMEKIRKKLQRKRKELDGEGDGASQIPNDGDSEGSSTTDLEKNAKASKGHWRSLPSGQIGTDQSGNKTPGRTWVNRSDRKTSFLGGAKNYAATAAAIAPVQILKQLTGVPESLAEGAIETKLLKGNVKDSLRDGGKKAGGRFLGGSIAASATGPLFFSGVKDLESEDRKTKARGAAKVVASGYAFKYLKGASEYAAMGKSVKGGGKTQALISIPASIVAAHGLAQTGRKSEKDPYLKGALYGGLTGAATGVAEARLLPENKLKSLVERKSLMKAKGLARLGAGAVGGMVGTYLWKNAIQPKLKEKKSFILSWGGKDYYGKGGEGEKVRPGVRAGYTKLFGVVPWPNLAVRVGNKQKGMSLGTAGIGIDRNRKKGRKKTEKKKEAGPKLDSFLKYLQNSKWAPRAAEWVWRASGVHTRRSGKRLTRAKARLSARKEVYDKRWESYGLEDPVARAKYFRGAEERLGRSQKYFEDARHDTRKARLQAAAAVGVPAGAVYTYRKHRSPSVGKKKVSQQAEGLRDFVKPYPHQERAIKRLMDTGALIFAHGVGTGKTVTSIAGFERLRESGKAKSALVIVPSGLKDNYSGAIEKFTTSSYQIIGSKGSKGKNTVYWGGVDPKKSYTIMSYSMFRRDPARAMAATGSDTLILDEYHRVRDPNGRTYKAAMSIRPQIKNFMGLTGSVLNNDPKEIVPLMNLAAGKEVMRPSEFSHRYMRRYARTKGFFGGDRWLVEMKNLPEMKQRVGPHVDYVSTDDVGKALPKREMEEVHVPMSAEQKKIYNWTMAKVDPITAWKIRKNLPVSQKQAKHVFGQITQARQAANTVNPFVEGLSPKDAVAQSPKVSKLLNDAAAHLNETSDGKVVIYSNLVKGGVDIVTAGLRARGIDHAVFVGKGRKIGDQKITEGIRNQGVDDFKAGKKKVIVLSGAGAEGLSLNNATMFQSLDGHFNPERTRQAEARARRIGGQSHRAPEDRKVLVKRYFTVFPKKSAFKRFFTGKSDSTTDQWIDRVAREKHQLNEQARSAFQQPALAISGTSTPPKKPGFFKSLFKGPKKIEGTKLKKPTKYKKRWRNLKTGEWEYSY